MPFYEISTCQENKTWIFENDSKTNDHENIMNKEKSNVCRIHQKDKAGQSKEDN